MDHGNAPPGQGTPDDGHKAHDHHDHHDHHEQLSRHGHHGHHNHRAQHDSHAHAGGHHHHGDPQSQAWSFAIAIALNAIFVVVEFGYGFVAHSTALMADAGHNLSDVLGLALAWGASVLVRSTPNSRFTYGLRGSSTLVALANAVFLLLTCGAIAWEALQRLWGAPEVNAGTVMTVAAIGILINGVSALLFMRSNETDLNRRGAYLHMASDAAISVGVVVSALLIRWTHWNWIDPVTSMIIVLVIVYGTWGLLSQSLLLALQAVPGHVDGAAIQAYLRRQDGIKDLHDLHIWGMSSTECALTVHLVMPGGYPGDAFVDRLRDELKESHGVQHATLQIELGTTLHACSLHDQGARKSGHA